MSLAAVPQTEAAFQAAVIQLARINGFRIFHHHDSRRQVRPGVFVGDRDASGYPDLTLLRERVLWCELKRDRGRLSVAQSDWINALRDAGQEAYIWRPGDWLEIERVLGRERHGA